VTFTFSLFQGITQKYPNKNRTQNIEYKNSVNRKYWKYKNKQYEVPIQNTNMLNSFKKI